MKRPNWQELFAEFCTQRENMPFAWGTNDCVLFAADCVCATTGMELTSDETNDPTRKMLRQLLAVFAEFNKNLLVYRMREGRKAKRLKSGRCEGTKPYGYYEHERLGQARLKELYEQRCASRWPHKLTWHKIAVQMNVEGYRNRAGKPFGVGSVQKICKQFKATRRLELLGA